VAGDAPPGELEARQLPSDPALLLRSQDPRPEKVPLSQLHDEPQPGLQRRDGLVDIVSVEGQARLQPQRIASAKAARQDPVLPARLQETEPALLRIPGIEVDLEPVSPRVAGARDEGGRAADRPLVEMIRRKLRQGTIGGAAA